MASQEVLRCDILSCLMVMVLTVFGLGLRVLEIWGFIHTATALSDVGIKTPLPHIPI